MTVRYQWVDSPVGALLLAADDTGVRRLAFASGRWPTRVDAAWCEGAHPVLSSLRGQLDEYFEGRRQRFDLPLAPEGTAFQQRVWRALTGIPYGETRSYGDLARTLDQPNAMRAVGAANGRNPIAIVVPCHRVIGADGSLTGFGGGLPVKQHLLRLEGALPPMDDLFAGPGD